MKDNPFYRQAQYHKREMNKWRIASIILGVILFLSILSLCCF